MAAPDGLTLNSIVAVLSVTEVTRTSETTGGAGPDVNCCTAPSAEPVALSATAWK